MAYVSIHAAQAGCDQIAEYQIFELRGFNSRSPSGLRLYNSPVQQLERLFQFTQPKRAATKLMAQARAKGKVSIHAAQAGCDAEDSTVFLGALSFNSRSPSGLRPVVSATISRSSSFQFTQPKRAATLGLVLLPAALRCFNSRSPSGLRHPVGFILRSQRLFQFTQPKRAATRYSSGLY